MALTDSLVAYYKLDETGTSNASDSSGSGLTLTNTGPWTYATGKINNGFDGGATNTTKWGVNATSWSLGNGSMSMSCWVNVTTAPTSGNIVCMMSSFNGATDVYYGLEYWNTAGLTIKGRRGKFGVGDESVDSVQTMTTGTWYHLVFTYDGANGNLYVNGSLAAGPTAMSGDGSSSNTTGAYVGGSVQDGFGTAHIPFSGLIDEVGVWTRAITSTEVTTLYNGGAGLQYPFSTGTTVFPSTLLLLGV